MALATLALVPAGPAFADHPQPRPDIAKMDYTPIGHYGSAAAGGKQPQIPRPGPAPEIGPNPSGKYVAYDTNVWESLALPSRHPGDEADNDPLGTGDPRPGFCPPNDPTFLPFGKCFNHQLEYLDYYERTMKEMLGDFGVVVHRYEFDSPGTGSRGGYLDAAGGRAFNISATVPGTDHPEQTVLVSGHYDFTDSGPAAAWDSAEGHAEVIRMAKIMSDYWRATGTRPSATVKFIPWDSEESGTFGSIDYVDNNIPPGEEDKVRGYFNVDPCASAYPAYRNGNPLNRIPEILQLADPAGLDEKNPKEKVQRERIERFNARALTVVDDVLDHLDDKLFDTPGQPEIFISDAESKAGAGPSQRGEIKTALGGLAIFSSDYANFEAIGVPIFNLFPDAFGPKADLEFGSPEGVGILHTPRDNLNTINSLTSLDQTGQSASEGWAKGMEMCAHMESWYMLQPEMGGAQTADAGPVAYYEALPNEAVRKQAVRFDASGTYQYAKPETRALIDGSKLEYSWDFGDGEKATGQVVEHKYTEVGRYATTLTVRNAEGGQQDTMGLPVTVIGARFDAPVLERPAAEDGDGTFPLKWEFSGEKRGFREFAVEEATDHVRLLSDGAEDTLDRYWTASDSPGDPVQPWQRSDSPTLKTLGNKRHSGEASFWSGASPSAAPAGTGIETTLTLKEPIRVPMQGDATLSYWSLFAMELDDEGRVEVAVVGEGQGGEPEFQALDEVKGTLCADEPAGLQRDFQSRSVDLNKFRGDKILVRFRLLYGDQEGNRCQPAGWYVDDINLDSGSFTAIGTTAQQTFEVFGKPKGAYAYRIKGVYNDGIETAASNVEQVSVTQGVPLPPGAPGSSGGCKAPRGFKRVRVTPTRRGGLRFRVRRAEKRKFTVEITRHSGKRSVYERGRRVVRFRGRSKSFAWRPEQRLASGYFSTTVAMRTQSGVRDVRTFALRRAAGRFTRRPPFAGPSRCGALSNFRLSGPAFGGRTRRPLEIAFRLNRPAQVALRITRGGKTVRRYLPAARLPGRTYRLSLPAAGLAAGDYAVGLATTRGASAKRAKLHARKL